VKLGKEKEGKKGRTWEVVEVEGNSWSPGLKGGTKKSGEKNRGWVLGTQP